MAICIPIRKISEGTETVEYRFGDDTERRWGRLRLDKRSGGVKIVVPAPGDENGFLSRHAARKVFLHWREGEFPDATCRAS